MNTKEVTSYIQGLQQAISLLQEFKKEEEGFFGEVWIERCERKLQEYVALIGLNQ